MSTSTNALVALLNCVEKTEISIITPDGKMPRLLFKPADHGKKPAVAVGCVTPTHLIFISVKANRIGVI